MQTYTLTKQQVADVLELIGNEKSALQACVDDEYNAHDEHHYAEELADLTELANVFLPGVAR